MIESLKKAEPLLLEACKFAEEENDITNFRCTFFNDFEEGKRDFTEIKRNYAFENKKILLKNNSEQNYDWKDYFQTY